MKVGTVSPKRKNNKILLCINKKPKLPTSTDSTVLNANSREELRSSFSLHKFQLKETLSAYNVERLSEFKFLSSLSAT